MHLPFASILNLNFPKLRLRIKGRCNSCTKNIFYLIHQITSKDEAPCHPIIFPLFILIFCYLARGTLVGFHFLNLHQKIQQYHIIQEILPHQEQHDGEQCHFPFPSFGYMKIQINHCLFSFFFFLLSQFLHFLLLSATLFHISV